jgi:RNA polymerase II-associated protein 2
MASTSDARPPKGILKKKTNYPPVAEPVRTSLVTATTYAEQDEAARVMATFPVIEMLTGFPRDQGPELTAAQPSERDATLFRSEVTKLTRSEFGDLVEERNCEGKCGYALCPSGKRNFRNAFKIWKGDVASTEHLNKWCSDSCARRALNVQLQLGVVPTYGIAAAKTVELLGDESGNSQPASGQTKKLPIEPSMSAKPTNSNGHKVADFQEDVAVMEKSVTKPPVAPTNTHGSTSNSHLIMEGHATRFGAVPPSAPAEEGEVTR